MYSPIQIPGEMMSFGVSPVNYMYSDNEIIAFLGLMMLVHPIKTVVLDVFGTGKTQIAVKMSGA